MIEPDCSHDICQLADASHDYLHRAYAGRLHPQLDVSRWVTHKHASGPLSRDIEPVAAEGPANA